MLLTVVVAAIVQPTLTFTFKVPGQQQWQLRSVRANATRGAGGTPNRAYQLSISDGTNVVAQSGAQDNATDPGTCVVTWTNSALAVVDAGGAGVSIAPLPNVKLSPGYLVTGTIVNDVVGDTWTDAVIWFDYVMSSS